MIPLLLLCLTGRVEGTTPRRSDNTIWGAVFCQPCAHLSTPPSTAPVTQPAAGAVLPALPRRRCLVSAIGARRSALGALHPVLFALRLSTSSPTRLYGFWRGLQWRAASGLGGRTPASTLRHSAGEASASTLAPTNRCWGDCVSRSACARLLAWRVACSGAQPRWLLDYHRLAPRLSMQLARSPRSAQPPRPPRPLRPLAWPAVARGLRPRRVARNGARPS